MVRKDLQIFFSDRRAVIVSFVVPIAIAAFFGSIFAGSGNRNTERARIAAAVVDHDQSRVSQAIVSGLQNDDMLRISTPEESAAREAVRAGQLSVGVVIPKDFGSASARAMFGGGDKPKLDLIFDPSRSMELSVVRGVLTQHVMEAVSREAMSAPAVADAIPQIESSSMEPAQKAMLLQLLRSVQGMNAVNNGQPAKGRTAGGFSMPYDTLEEAMAGPDSTYNGYAHSFGGMAVQFLLFAMSNLGLEMLLERQRGLWRRLRSAPVSRFTLLAGRAISGALISFLILIVCFAFAMAFFHVRITGSAIGFLGVAAACSIMASTFGLLVAALGNSPATARGVTTLAVLMMTMLGGAWVPTFVFPAWAQQVTQIIPVRWAVDGLDATTWRGTPFSGVVVPIMALLAFALGFAVLAASRFRWEESA
ncbi:MAG TPA: ABC transporter permease [Vicinamibacterales bacterium]|nr:ABC transporter permease [Vicinamibacterales bacterium]